MAFTLGPKFGSNNVCTAFASGEGAISETFSAGTAVIVKFGGVVTVTANNADGYYINLINSETGQTANYTDIRDITVSNGDTVAEGTVLGIKPHKYNILNVALHLASAGGASENFTIQVDHGVSDHFDFTLIKQDMNAVTDVIYQPSSIDSALLFTSTDTIKFVYANTNNRHWGIMVTYGYMGRDE